MRNQTKRAIDRLNGTGFAEAFFFPGEDRNKFNEFCDDIFLEHRPNGPSEEIYACEIAKLLWRKMWPLQVSPPEQDSLSEALNRFRVEVLGEEPRQPPSEPLVKKDDGPRLDAETLRAEREFADNIDAAIKEAEKQLAQLKEMKRRAVLGSTACLDRGAREGGAREGGPIT